MAVPDSLQRGHSDGNDERSLFARRFCLFSATCFALSLGGLALTWAGYSLGFALVNAASVPSVALCLVGCFPPLVKMKRESRAAAAARCYAVGTALGLSLATLSMLGGDSLAECRAAAPACRALLGLHISHMAVAMTFGVLFIGVVPFACALSLMGFSRAKWRVGAWLCTLGVVLSTVGACHFGYVLGHA